MTSISVEPILGEPSRFLVASRSGRDPHLVDLEENKGKSWCSCPHHEFRIQPLIERGELHPACRHVIEARAFLKRKVSQRTETEK